MLKSMNSPCPKLYDYHRSLTYPDPDNFNILGYTMIYYDILKIIIYYNQHTVIYYNIL